MKPSLRELEEIILPLIRKQYSGKHFSSVTPEQLREFVRPIMISHEWSFDEYMKTKAEDTKNFYREDRNRRKILRKQRKEQRKVETN